MASIDNEVRRTALGGVAWESLSFISGKLCTLITMMLLARLLTPADFGLVAFALAFAACAGIVADLGTGRAVIYLPIDRAATNTAVTIAALFASVIAAGSFLMAPTLASVLGRAEVAPMIRALCFGMFVEAIGQVPDGMLRRSFRFRARMITNLAAVGTRSVLAVILAVAGFNGWAIIGGYVAGQIIGTLLSWHLSGLSFSIPARAEIRTRSRSFLDYGIPVAGNALLLTILVNVDYLIVARRLGAEPLGLYMMAARVADLAILQALWIVGAVSFPVYSALRDDVASLRNTYLTATRLQIAYGLCAALVLVLLAPILIPIMFGDQWTESVALLQALAVYAAFRTLGTGITELANAVGRPRLNVWMSAAHLLMLASAVWLAAGFSVTAVAWTQVGVAAGMALVAQGIAFRLLGLPLHALLTHRTTGSVAPLIAVR